MIKRQITEREFINYAKVLGNYCTYSDTLIIVEAIFKSFKHVLGEKSKPIGELLPKLVKPIWDRAAFSDDLNESIVDLIQIYANLATRREAGIALITLFGTIKEKQAGLLDRWEALMPDDIKFYWERSRTIDEVQDASECL